MFLNFVNEVLGFFKNLWEKVVAFHDGLEKEMQYALYAGIAVVVVLIIVLIVSGAKKSKKKKAAKKALKETEVKTETMEEKAEETVLEEKEEVKEEKALEVVVEEKEEINIEEAVIKEKTEEAVVEEKRAVFGKYEVYQDSDFFKYTLKASNGEVLIDSEVYSSLDGVYNAIESVKKNVTEGHLLISRDKNNAFQFKLIAKNHRVLAVSANYSSEKAAIRASESFKRFAVDANIVELSPSEVVSTITKIKIGKVEAKEGGKIVIEKEGGEFFFKVFASNNEMMCSSMGYKAKSGAIAAIETFKTAIIQGNFYVVKDKRSNYQFKLYSGSNRLIAVGQSYKNKTQAKQSASIVVSYMDNASIVEE